MDRLSQRFASGSGESDVDQDNCSNSEATDLSSQLHERGKSSSHASQDVTMADDEASIDTTRSPDGDAQSTSVTVRPTKVSRLFDLPQELFDEIVKYLGPSNIVCLALANKELFRRFNNVHGEQPAESAPDPSTSDPSIPAPQPALVPASWKVLGDYIKKIDSVNGKSKARNSLLSTIDSDLLDLVYCYKCKKLHDPFITFIDRAYVPNKAAKCVDYAIDHHMPPRATRKLLRTITKARNKGAPYEHLMQQVNNTSTVYKNGILVQLALRMRYRGDLLLLRRQQVISSMDKTSLAIWLFTQQLKHPAPSGAASTSSPIVYKICNHGTWAEKYDSVITDLTNPHCRPPTTSSEAPIEEHRHTPKCFNQDYYDAAEDKSSLIFQRFEELRKGSKTKAGSEDETKGPILGRIVGCGKCTTDFQMDVVKLPAPFHWGFVLTTWLDLGNIDFCQKWDSHRELRPGRVFVRDPHEHGGICEKYESINSITKTPYIPEISELNLERMGNYGWGKQAAQGRNKYMSWSLAHSPDPSTGKIPDPDPLEPEDLSG